MFLCTSLIVLYHWYVEGVQLLVNLPSVRNSVDPACPVEEWLGTTGPFTWPKGRELNKLGFLVRKAVSRRLANGTGCDGAAVCLIRTLEGLALIVGCVAEA